MKIRSLLLSMITPLSVGESQLYSVPTLLICMVAVMKESDLNNAPMEWQASKISYAAGEWLPDEKTTFGAKAGISYQHWQEPYQSGMKPSPSPVSVWYHPSSRSSFMAVPSRL